MAKTIEQEERVSVTYACGHVWFFRGTAPTRGALVWCRRCERDTRVSKGATNITVRCRACAWKAPYGASRIAADSAAITHKNAHTGHVVDVRDGSEILHTFGTVTVPRPDSDTSEIPY
jgi:hypothetical protein